MHFLYNSLIFNTLKIAFFRGVLGHIGAKYVIQQIFDRVHARVYYNNKDYACARDIIAKNGTKCVKMQNKLNFLHKILAYSKYL